LCIIGIIPWKIKVDENLKLGSAGIGASSMSTPDMLDISKE
jgi:hypothetical protein